MSKDPKEKKGHSLSFRVPKAIRKAVKWGAKYESAKNGKKVSQSDFMLLATADLLDWLDEHNEKLLPTEFVDPKGKNSEAKMMTIRVPLEMAERLQHYAPRVLNSATRLILWAALRRSFDCRDDSVKKK